MTTRAFCIINEISIKFDENVIHWNITQKELFEIRAGRNLVIFNEVLRRLLDLLYEYDITDEEYYFIRDTIWQYLFQVARQ
jgi:hypothetical protein